MVVRTLGVLTFEDCEDWLEEIREAHSRLGIARILTDHTELERMALDTDEIRRFMEGLIATIGPLSLSQAVVTSAPFNVALSRQAAMIFEAKTEMKSELNQAFFESFDEAWSWLMTQDAPPHP
jgi:hypothetical protein